MHASSFNGLECLRLRTCSHRSDGRLSSSNSLARSFLPFRLLTLPYSLESKSSCEIRVAMLTSTFTISLATCLLLLSTVSAQNRCYYGPGAGFRGPSELVPCNTSSTYSSCCLAGDTCLSGSACYNYATGNTYQYGCTDINYADESCPSKCGWDPAKSPWMSILFCSDIQDLTNTWSCLGPESCGCDWNSSYALQILPSRGCDAMGSEARVALYAPSTLLPYVSLAATAGGSPTYYSTTTGSDGEFSIISTAIVGCKRCSPSTFGNKQLTQSYRHTRLVHPIHDVSRGARPRRLYKPRCYSIAFNPSCGVHLHRLHAPSAASSYHLISRFKLGVNLVVIRQYHDI